VENNLNEKKAESMIRPCTTCGEAKKMPKIQINEDL